VISNQKQNAKKEIHPSSKNFEAVVTFKSYCDEKYNLLVCRSMTVVVTWICLPLFLRQTAKEWILPSK